MIDIRIALDVDHPEFEKMIKGWCDEAGEGISYSFEQRQPKVQPTKTDNSNIYWGAFTKAIDELYDKFRGLFTSQFFFNFIFFLNF